MHKVSTKNGVLLVRLTLHERGSRNTVGRLSANENWRIAWYNETDYKNTTREQSVTNNSCEFSLRNKYPT